MSPLITYANFIRLRYEVTEQKKQRASERLAGNLKAIETLCAVKHAKYTLYNFALSSFPNLTPFKKRRRAARAFSLDPPGRPQNTVILHRRSFSFPYDVFLCVRSAFISTLGAADYSLAFGRGEHFSRFFVCNGERAKNYWIVAGNGSAFLFLIPTGCWLCFFFFSSFMWGFKFVFEVSFTLDGL